MSLDIRDGFRGRTLFLTGGTGFVGKVLLYKLLKEFPDIDAIYLLMRGKHSRRYKRFLTPQERLELDVFSSPCFDPLRTSVGEAAWATLRRKVKAMNGDITADYLGLSADDRSTITDKVNLIVHMAATVDFNARLDIAVQMNTLGSLRVLALAKACRQLESMVHISTCYVNYTRQGSAAVSKECIYAAPFDAEQVCKYILGLHESEVERECKEILRRYGFPNTYTLTKSIGERLIERYKGDVPLAIVRPSIIGCSLFEPFPGWVDVLTAAGGLLLTSALGVVREIVCDADMVADVVPVDFVVNVICKALFKEQVVHQQRKPHIQQHNNITTGTSSSNGYCALSTKSTTAAMSAANPICSEKTTTTATNGCAGTQHDSSHAATAAISMSPALSVKNAAGNDLHSAVAPSGGHAPLATTVASAMVNAAASALTVAREHVAVAGKPATAMTQTSLSSPRLAEASVQQHPKAKLASATTTAMQPTTIYQVSTTGSRNAVTWGRLAEALRTYINSVGTHPKALAPCSVVLTTSNIYYMLRYHLLRYTPYLTLQALLQLPEPVGTPERRRVVERLGRALRRAHLLNNEFHDFVVHEWYFDNTNTIALDADLNDYSKQSFVYDPYAINWRAYTQLYTYGILKHIVRDTGNLPIPVMPPSATELLQRASML